MPTFTPVDDQILVLRDPPQTVTNGGLHLPERDVTRPLRGTVLAVGPGPKPRVPVEERVPCSVRPGDVVLFGRYAGHEVSFDGRDCLVLRETEVLGVLQDDTDAERGLCAEVALEVCQGCGETAQRAVACEDGATRGVCASVDCFDQLEAVGGSGAWASAIRQASG